MSENKQPDSLDELVNKLKSNLLTSEGKDIQEIGKIRTNTLFEHKSRPSKIQNDQETPVMDVMYY
jgi:hypothetical protein